PVPVPLHSSPLLRLSFFLLLRPHPRPTLFPYTTLFRSPPPSAAPPSDSPKPSSDRLSLSASPDCCWRSPTSSRSGSCRPPATRWKVWATVSLCLPRGLSVSISPPQGWERSSRYSLQGFLYVPRRSSGSTSA